jgi:hypothetical protein
LIPFWQRDKHWDDFAAFAPCERDEIIAETTTAIGVDSTIIEKDFWVCWMLQRLLGLTHGFIRNVVFVQFQTMFQGDALIEYEAFALPFAIFAGNRF